ncbi:unnamed protein product (macronuclear) [Paramecium tetraurelia]|uniref:Transmembrane protein n=1 Tax=Paramecium tetraurelia TaxID=5888 RepID=A0CFB1_PARTE|nr:uncharacterized protein GSPATT00037917001 [Paramecium tetraurelia]CAK69478.1 unnamed protein product [Paramecium tetraurelia]|eukprot:XP_001436875.1 hypothetical protein (macronuclear) [Paramecium tetraurelia strain d4-2]
MESLYSLLSQILLITTSVILLISMTIAFRKIIKDVNDILDSTDKLVFFIAAIQQLLLLAFLIQQYTLFLSGLRILRMLQDIMLLNCLIKLDSDNEQSYQKIVDKISQTLSFILLSVWCVIIFLEGFQSHFQCDQQIWMLLSGLLLLNNIIQLYFGLNILIQIYKYCQDSSNQHMFDGLHKIMMDELQNRKVQVIVFVLCSINSSVIMFLYDYNIFDLLNPTLCLQKNTITEILIYIAVIMVSYQLPCLGIYYVFYHKNKKYLNNHNWEIQRNIVNFYDERSEIELGDYQNPQ